MAMDEIISQTLKHFREDDKMSVFEKNTTLWDFSKTCDCEKIQTWLRKCFLENSYTRISKLCHVRMLWEQ